MIQKELTHQQIQDCSLSILKQVHQFCAEHHIHYSLSYGTLIGAIRHKGFIPWDDDIDIMMLRPDYEKFCKSFIADGLGICSEYDSDCYINYCRVFDIKNTYCKTIIPFKKDYKGGVWIDVFPIDSVADSFDSFKTQIKQMSILWMKQMRYRDSLSSFKEILNMFSPKEVLLLSAIKFSFLGERFLNCTNRKLREMAQSIPFGSSKHLSQLGVLDDGFKNYQSFHDFESYIDVPFEGFFFKSIAGYDSFLKRIYNDYWELPPEKDRVPKHTHAHFYWKADSGY